MADELVMPRLSDTMERGTIARWVKQEGDAFQNGDVLAEIETDKALMELNAYDDGVLLKILVPDGGEAELGAPIAITGEAGEEVPADLAVAAPAPAAAVEAAAEAEMGEALPAATVCYVWDSAHPAGRQGANPYTRRVRYISLRGSEAPTGQWLSEQRDLARDFATLEDEQRGDRADAVLAGDARVLVRVQLYELHTAVVLAGQLLHDRSDHAAGAAPRRPEVDQDGRVVVDDVGLKGRVGGVGRVSHLAFLSADAGPLLDSFTLPCRGWR